MPPELSKYLQLGATAVIAIFVIYKLFDFISKTLSEHTSVIVKMTSAMTELKTVIQDVVVPELRRRSNKDG